MVEDLKLALTASSLAASAFIAPTPASCSVGCMPRLGSAFSVPVPSQRWSELGGESCTHHAWVCQTDNGVRL